MSDNSLPRHPDGVRLRKHEGADLFFAYPDGAKFAEFSHADGTSVTRLVVETGGARLRLELDKLSGSRTAREWAELLYQQTPSQPENTVPVQVRNNGLEMWRMRRVFMEGGSDLMFNEVAFIQVGSGVYRLTYYQRPAAFAQGLWLFDTVFQTLHMVER